MSSSRSMCDGLLRGAGMTQRQLHHWKSTRWWLVIHKSGTSQEPPASCRHLDKRESLSLVVLTSVYHEESAVVLTCIQGLPETCELFTSWVLMSFPWGRDITIQRKLLYKDPWPVSPIKPFLKLLSAGDFIRATGKGQDSALGNA